MHLGFALLSYKITKYTKLASSLPIFTRMGEEPNHEGETVTLLETLCLVQYSTNYFSLILKKSKNIFASF